MESFFDSGVVWCTRLIPSFQMTEEINFISLGISPIYYHVIYSSLLLTCFRSCYWQLGQQHNTSIAHGPEPAPSRCPMTVHVWSFCSHYPSPSSPGAPMVMIAVFFLFRFKSFYSAAPLVIGGMVFWNSSHKNFWKFQIE
ncbi:hypothetical protein ElyMa_002734900 [Elysia marginata]|uniref:Uncharacterized protein n=1 Tax=Elysia marginata TaxID=1093978 RepID=A0AAV4HGE3_9GAST|nr:hypothetical protein ElyMa_002734900 [Elysia marginata]